MEIDPFYIKVVKVKKNENLCELCYETIKEYRMIKLYLCDHIFCDKCIDKQIAYSLKTFALFTCPSCNAEHDENSVLFKILNRRERKIINQII